MVPSSVFPVLGWALLAVGAALILTGVGILVLTWSRSARWQHRTATAVDDAFTWGVGADIDSSGYRRLVLEWLGDDGVTRRHTESYGRTRVRVPVGKQLPILVDPTRPDHIQRAGTGGYAVLVIMVGALFVTFRLFVW